MILSLPFNTTEDLSGVSRVLTRRWIVLVIGCVTFTRAIAEPIPPVEHDATQLGTGYDRYRTHDTLGRTIPFYLSAARSPEERLPLAVFIQGSGCDSIFTKHGDAIYGGLQNILRSAAKGRVRVLAVEKPGVSYLDVSKQPGTAIGCPQQFLAEHTLERWSEAVSATVRAAIRLPGVDPAKILIMGHSEGGEVAARVAAETPAVTHVATLAGGGPTQLFDFSVLDRDKADKPGTPDERAQSVFNEWAKVLADPISVTKFWKGHPYRRWSSFLTTSPLENLLKTKAKVYIAHGSADRATPVASFDVLRAELAAHGKEVVAERIEGADHSFHKRVTTGRPIEMEELMGRVVDWFLMPNPIGLTKP